MHFNLFSVVLFFFALAGLIGASVYPDQKREGYVSAAIFGTLGLVLLFV